MNQKTVYICGPLTELPRAEQAKVKSFYGAIADVVENVMGMRAFVPHEHYDPILHAGYTPQEIDAAERAQVCKRTSLLLVVTIQPSWGGGIEVEMARQSGVPVVLLCERSKLEACKISRLLRGNAAIEQIIPYGSEEDALEKLLVELPKFRFLCTAV
jgi:hypothetical protein